MRKWEIWGISELNCWLGHRNPTAGSPSGRDAEDCLDGHLACGIDRVVWDLGRSVLLYHSDLLEATCKGLRSNLPTLTAVQHAVEKIYQERCQLRAALRYSRTHNITLYGRLCMNRHYKPGTSHRSQFAQDNPQWCEVDENGWLDVTRMCYGIPEYRQERINILMEAVNIGVDGLHLDFCRQPPAVRYHPIFVNGYREKTGIDPRTLALDDKEDYLDWCAYRAQSVTDLLRALKEQLNAFQKRWQRTIPVRVRIPNDGFAANLIAGLDIKAWCEEGLIDELALSELRWLNSFTDWDDKPYIDLAKNYSIPVYGSSNCLPVQDGGWSGEVNPRGINPLVLAKRALASFEDGAQGISLYQSDTGIQRPGLRDAIIAMSVPDTLRTYIKSVEKKGIYPITDENAFFGIDNHSKLAIFRKN